MPSERGPGDDRDLKRFTTGLFPILQAGDVARFRRYLVEWEELLGDLSQLTLASDAELRRAMREIRLHPRQFGLPPWPRGAAEARHPRAEREAADSPVGAEIEKDTAGPAPGAAPGPRTLFPLPPARERASAPPPPRVRRSDRAAARQLDLFEKPG